MRVSSLETVHSREITVTDLKEAASKHVRQSSYYYEELLAAGRGEIFGMGNAQLPLPPMLMFDRISEISATGGEYGKGIMRAELDVNPDLWFFGCHFKGDPVMPGCLGLDALWQMVGFFLVWSGGEGPGRALGLGELKLSGQVLPNVRKVVYNHRHQARDALEAGAGHRRRVAFRRWRDYLSREGLEGRPVQAGRRGAAGNLKLVSSLAAASGNNEMTRTRRS